MEHQQYEATHPAITDVTSTAFDRLAVVYAADGGASVRALGFQLGQVVRRHQRIENPPSIAAGESLDLGKFTTEGHTEAAGVSGTASDIFAIGSGRQSTIEEVGVAIDTDGLLAAVAVGNSTITALEETGRARGFSPDDYADFGAVRSELTTTGTDSDTDTEYPLPTTALAPKRDQGLIRFDGRETGNNPFYFGFHNPTGAGVDLDVYAVGYRYSVSVLSDAALVRDMVRGDVDARVVQHGSFDASNPNLPREWASNSVEVTTPDLLP